MVAIPVLRSALSASVATTIDRKRAASASSCPGHCLAPAIAPITERSPTGIRLCATWSVCAHCTTRFQRFVLTSFLRWPQIHSDKHGFGRGYTGYGSKTALNEVGAMGIASAGATEDSIDLMVRGCGVVALLVRWSDPEVARPAGCSDRVRALLQIGCVRCHIAHNG